MRDNCEIPRTKHIASNMFDLPDPFKPVIAVNDLSNGVIVVAYAYDLKPSKIIYSNHILMWEWEFFNTIVCITMN